MNTWEPGKPYEYNKPAPDPEPTPKPVNPWPAPVTPPAPKPEPVVPAPVDKPAPKPKAKAKAKPEPKAKAAAKDAAVEPAPEGLVFAASRDHLPGIEPLERVLLVQANKALAKAGWERRDQEDIEQAHVARWVRPAGRPAEHAPADLAAMAEAVDILAKVGWKRVEG
jgi:outer membrane biosynthesis protein TonB